MVKSKSQETDTLPEAKTKATERDCPRCHFVVVQNEKEECFECTHCGYIDCGDE